MSENTLTLSVREVEWQNFGGMEVTAEDFDGHRVVLSGIPDERVSSWTRLVVTYHFEEADHA